MGWCIFDKDTRQPMKRKQYNLGVRVWTLAPASLGWLSAVPFVGDVALGKYCRLASPEADLES